MLAVGGAKTSLSTHRLVGACFLPRGRTYIVGTARDDKRELMSGMATIFVRMQILAHHPGYVMHH